MKVAHVCPFVGEQMGGSERYVANLSKTQSDEHDIHIFTTTRHLAKTGTSTIDGVIIHKFYSPLVPWSINPLALMLGALVKFEADVYHIHSYLYASSNQAVLARRLTRRRALLQLHGGVGTPPYQTTLVRRVVKQFYDASLGKFTIGNSDAVASVSQVDIDFISRKYDVPVEKLYHLPNAVDIGKFKPSRKSRASKMPTFLYVGDLEPWKGIGSLIEWIGNERGWREIAFKMRFVGQGSLFPLLQKLERETKKNGGPIQVEALGERDHNAIPEIMRNADALVFPSFWEGMPTVVLEAMASGIPVISTRVGEVTRILKDRHTGLLIERNFESFRKAIEIVLNEASIVKKIGLQSRRLVEEEYSLSRINQLVNNIYQNILQ